MKTSTSACDNPCTCPAPGHCPRWGREVFGRFWQACRGETGKGREWEVALLTGGTLPGRTACRHLGEPTVERRQCPTCNGNVEVKLMACAVYGQCSTRKRLDGVQCCEGCPDYSGSIPSAGV